jgi:hypothetical protein
MSLSNHKNSSILEEEIFPNISEKEFCGQEAKWWLKDAETHYQEFLYSLKRAQAWQVQADACKSSR